MEILICYQVENGGFYVSDVVLDVMLESSRQCVLGEVNSHAETIADKTAQNFPGNHGPISINIWLHSSCWAFFRPGILSGPDRW